MNAAKPTCTHREQLPVRECRSCGAYLRSYQESTQCDPCGTPAWEIVDESDLFEAMAAGTYGRSDEVADALHRIWEMTPA